MGSHQFSGSNAANADFSYSSHPIFPSSLPNRLLESAKFDVKNSPNSTLLTHFDCDTTTTLSDSQEQHSSTENISGISPSYISSFESNNYFNWLSPYVNCSLDSLPFTSSRTSYLLEESYNQEVKHALQKLETTLMEADEVEQVATSDTSCEEEITLNEPGQSSRAWNQEWKHSQVIQPHSSIDYKYRPAGEGGHLKKYRKTMEDSSVHGIPIRNLKQLLFECARAIYENRIDDFDNLIQKSKESVSINGEPIQRLGAYIVEGLVARKEASGSNIYHALRCKEPESKDLLSSMQFLYQICPYMKFGYMAANGAIAEACRNEDCIHIVDFQIAQGTQWVTLLQALAVRPSGAPHVRITGIDDPVSRYARGEGLEAVGRRLAVLSEKFNIPVEFHGLPVFAPDVTRDMLDVRPGEALAVNFPLQLHHTPDESVDMNNPRDGLLRMVKSLSPKVTTLVEQESNTNTTPFLERFNETLEYYLAIFESIDVTLERDRKDRIHMEQHCLARDIVNVIACEGKERVERHELFRKWKSRLTMAGFCPYPLSSYVNSVISSLLKSYSENYTLLEKDGAMLLRWKKRDLISASAWH